MSDPPLPPDPARRSLLGRARPPPGLYDPANDKDACGVAFVADARGRRSRAIVAHGPHRAAQPRPPRRRRRRAQLRRRRRASSPRSPTRCCAPSVDFDLPPMGEYAVGIAFLPADDAERAARVEDVARLAAEEGLTVLGWRDVPVDPDGADLGPTARAVMPHFAQLFVAETMGARADDERLRRQRRAATASPGSSGAPSCCASGPSGPPSTPAARCYIASLSSRTITYKGMLTTDQLPAFFPDLRDERYESAIALVHSRFSTNTFPSWPLAHPFRLHRAQRRDQHDQGQPQPDAGPRGEARHRAVRRPGRPGLRARPGPDLPGDRRRLQRLGHLRRGARAAAPVGPVAAARGADDDPGGVGEPRGDGPGPPGLLPVPRLDHGAVGRPGRGRASPTAR